jgi:ligand-binding SRPBCC domain-containing protein
MATLERSICVARPIAEVFDFFSQPANLIVVSPPELNMRLAGGPERVHLGARVKVSGGAWGIPLTVESEVTAFEPPHLFTDEQRQGPLGKWVHTHRFEEISGGTRVLDRIEYAAPTGVLGMLVTEAMIATELKWVFEHRERKIRELLGDYPTAALPS